jgi:hypothetical protein
MRGVDLADLTERGATPTGSSSDPHLQRWFTADIGDLSDEPPIGALRAYTVNPLQFRLWTKWNQ